MIREPIPKVEANLPSGYLSVEQIDPSLVTSAELPWLKENTELSTVRCTLMGGETFLLANAVGTHPSLIASAEKMNDHQNRNCNNMFYSRLAGFVGGNYTPSAQVQSFPDLDGAPTYCMRNAGGQRVYFSVLTNPRSNEKLVVRLAACDKESQAKVMSVLDTSSSSGKIKFKGRRGSK